MGNFGSVADALLPVMAGHGISARSWREEARHREVPAGDCSDERACELRLTVLNEAWLSEDELPIDR
jgi:hypothetical protein